MQYYFEKIKKLMTASNGNIPSPGAVMLFLLEDYKSRNGGGFWQRDNHHLSLAGSYIQLLNKELPKPGMPGEKIRIIFAKLNLDFPLAKLNAADEFTKLIKAFLVCYPHYIRMLNPDLQIFFATQAYLHSLPDMQATILKMLYKTTSNNEILKKRFGTLTEKLQLDLLEKILIKTADSDWSTQHSACEALIKFCEIADSSVLEDKISKKLAERVNVNNEFIEHFHDYSNIKLLHIMPQTKVLEVVTRILSKISKEKIASLTKSYKDSMKENGSCVITDYVANQIKILAEVVEKLSSDFQENIIRAILDCTTEDNDYAHVTGEAISALGYLNKKGLITASYKERVVTAIVSRGQSKFSKQVIDAMMEFSTAEIKRLVPIATAQIFVGLTEFQTDSDAERFKPLIPYIDIKSKLEFIDKVVLQLKSNDYSKIINGAKLLKLFGNDPDIWSLKNSIVKHLYDAVQKQHYSQYEWVFSACIETMSYFIADISVSYELKISVLKLMLAKISHAPSENAGIEICRVINKYANFIPADLEDTLINRLMALANSDNVNGITIAVCETLGIIGARMSSTKKANIAKELKKCFSPSDLDLNKVVAKSLTQVMEIVPDIMYKIEEICDKMSFSFEEDNRTGAHMVVSKVITSSIESGFDESDFFSHMTQELFQEKKESYLIRKCYLELRQFAEANIIPAQKQLSSIVAFLVKEIENNGYFSSSEYRKEALAALLSMAAASTFDQKINYFSPILVSLYGKFKNDDEYKQQLTAAISDSHYDYRIHDEVLKLLPIDPASIVMNYAR
jgi:hypothetical protein